MTDAGARPAGLGVKAVRLQPVTSSGRAEMAAWPERAPLCADVHPQGAELAVTVRRLRSLNRTQNKMKLLKKM